MCQGHVGVAVATCHHLRVTVGAGLQTRAGAAAAAGGSSSAPTPLSSSGMVVVVVVVAVVAEGTSSNKVVVVAAATSSGAGRLSFTTAWQQMAATQAATCTGVQQQVALVATGVGAVVLVVARVGCGGAAHGITRWWSMQAMGCGCEGFRLFWAVAAQVKFRSTPSKNNNTNRPRLQHCVSVILAPSFVRVELGCVCSSSIASKATSAAELQTQVCDSPNLSLDHAPAGKCTGQVNQLEADLLLLLFLLCHPAQCQAHLHTPVTCHNHQLVSLLIHPAAPWQQSTDLSSLLSCCWVCRHARRVNSQPLVPQQQKLASNAYHRSAENVWFEP